MVFTVPGYQVDQLIGYGSSAEVWSARVAGTGEPVALKRIILRPGHTHPDQEAQQAATLVRSARTEAALLATLDHPSLIRLREYVQTAAAVVLVMDLAEGGSLAQLLRRRDRLTPAEVTAALSPIAAALAYAHDEGVLHGDVSAANILFSATGHPKLADLGVARMLIGQAAADRSLGTPAYVDPVLAAGGAAGAASDVFSLAAVAFHCLTGAGPWQSEDRADSRTALARAATGVIDDLAGRLAGCPEPMAAVLTRALDPEPHRRGTAAEFALDLGASVRPAPVVLTAGRIPSGVGRHSVDRQQAEAAEAFAVPADLTHVSRPQLRPEPVEQPRLGRFGRRRRRGGGLTAGVGLGSGVRPPSWIRLPARVATGGWPSTARRLAASSARESAPEAEPGEPPRSGWSRTGVLALVAALLGGGLIGFLIGGWPGSEHGAKAAAAVPISGSAVARPRPAREQPAAIAPRAASAQRAATAQRAASAPGAVSAPSALRALTQPADDPAAVLRRLADLRAQAFALNRPDLLSAVYQSPALLKQDVGQLRKRVPAGCGLVGLRTSYQSVAVVTAVAKPATPVRLELRVTASQPAASLICAGVIRAQTQPAAPVRLQLSLVEAGSGFRIAAQRPDRP